MIQDYLPKDASSYLQEELALRKARRPQYSLRAFARDLGMSPSALSEFLAGQQGMSKDRAVGIGGEAWNQEALPIPAHRPWHVVVVFIRWDWLSRAGSTKTIIPVNFQSDVSSS